MEKVVILHFYLKIQKIYESKKNYFAILQILVLVIIKR